MLPLTEPVTQSQDSTLPQQQVPTMPKSPIQPTPADATPPLEPKLDPRPIPPYPKLFFRPPPRPQDETIIKDSRKDLQDFDPDRKVEIQAGYLTSPYFKDLYLCSKLIFSQTEPIFVKKTSFCLNSVKASSGLRKMEKTFSSDPDEALTEFRQKLVFLTKIGSVCEKINLLHYN